MPVFGRLARFYRPYLLTLYLGLFLMALFSAGLLVTPYLTEALINNVIDAHHWNLLIYLVGATVLLAAVTGAFNYAQQFFIQDFGQKCTYRLREALYARLQSHGYAYYDREHTGNLMQRLTGDVEAFRMFLTQGTTDAGTFVYNIVFATIVMFTLNWQLAVISMVLLPFLALSCIRYDRTVRPIYTLIRQAMSRLQTVVQENIMGVRTVKSFARETYEIATFDETNSLYRERNILAAVQASRYQPLMQLISNVGTVGVVWYGGMEVIHHQLSLGALVAFMAVLAYLTSPVQMLGFLVNLYAQAAASERRLLEIFETEDPVLESPGAQPLAPQAARGHVEFRHVGVRYPGAGGSSRPTLQDVNLDAPPGTVIALLGRTGSGKSTLVNLIPRFYDATEGEVLVDGHNVRDWTLRSLRRQIGVVPGETFLFSASLFENIAYGRSDASLADVQEAARLAEASEFVDEMPEGLDTIVGERGLGLSGGQRQRVALARALLFDPKILILDDATASVDMETEYRIQKTLGRVMQGRTTFIIAHRISSLRRADEIVVLDGGRVADRGRHEELIARDGLYREIFDMQFRDRDALSDARKAAAQ